jgi:cell division protein ZapA (FtsZ GTPase activity inhibitor)
VDRTISIRLFNQTYRFKADTEASEANRIAGYVVKEIEKAQASAEVPSRLDSVILAALNIANDYFELKRGHDAMVEDINRRCGLLIDYIDENV